MAPESSVADAAAAVCGCGVAIAHAFCAAAADVSTLTLEAALAAHGADPDDGHAVLVMPRACAAANATANATVPDFDASRQKEYDGLIAKGVMEPVSEADVPSGTKIVNMVNVEKVKRDGTAKTRFCIDGRSTTWGVHYDRTHSSCARSSSIRVLTAIAAAQFMTVTRVDFEQAYAQSPPLSTEKILYARLPRGLQRLAGWDENGRPRLMRILRPQYGMKDAGRAWQTTLNSFLVGDGFVRSSADPCVYRKVHRGADGVEHELIIATHVDDLLLMDSSPELRALFMKSSPLWHYYVGITAALRSSYGTITAVLRGDYVLDLTTRARIRNSLLTRA